MIRSRVGLAVALTLFWLDRIRNIGKPKSLDWIRGIASLELMCNPTIARYEFADGAEINRRTANPMAGLAAALDGLKEAIAERGNEIMLSLARVRRGLEP